MVTEGGFTQAVVAEAPLLRAQFIVDASQALAGVVLVAVILHVAAEAVRIGGHPAHVVQHVVIVDFFTVDVGGAITEPMA